MVLLVGAPLARRGGLARRPQLAEADAHERVVLAEHDAAVAALLDERPLFDGQDESSPGGDYPIAISGGNLDPTAVPEPSTWVMMLIGLAGVGSAAYRRGRKDRLAPTSI